MSGSPSTIYVFKYECKCTGCESNHGLRCTRRVTSKFEKTEEEQQALRCRVCKTHSNKCVICLGAPAKEGSDKCNHCSKHQFPCACPAHAGREPCTNTFSYATHICEECRDNCFQCSCTSLCETHMTGEACTNKSRGPDKKCDNCYIANRNGGWVYCKACPGKGYVYRQRIYWDSKNRLCVWHHRNEDRDPNLTPIRKLLVDDAFVKRVLETGVVATRHKVMCPVCLEVQDNLTSIWSCLCDSFVCDGCMKREGFEKRCVMCREKGPPIYPLKYEELEELLRHNFRYVERSAIKAACDIKFGYMKADYTMSSLATSAADVVKALKALNMDGPQHRVVQQKAAGLALDYWNVPEDFKRPGRFVIPVDGTGKEYHWHSVDFMDASRRLNAPEGFMQSLLVPRPWT